MNQADYDFWEWIMQERMTAHVAAKFSKDNESLRRFAELEQRYNGAVEEMEAAERSIVEEYVQTIFDQSSEKEVFFFRKGVRDGMVMAVLLEQLLA